MKLWSRKDGIESAYVPVFSVDSKFVNIAKWNGNKI